MALAIQLRLVVVAALVASLLPLSLGQSPSPTSSTPAPAPGYVECALVESVDTDGDGHPDTFTGRITRFQAAESCSDGPMSE